MFFDFDTTTAARKAAREQFAADKRIASVTFYVKDEPVEFRRSEMVAA